jgi:hypothetical protein
LAFPFPKELMQRIIVVLVLAGLVSMANPLGAQTDNAASWFAMMSTPYGGLPALAPTILGARRPDGRSGRGFAGRYGRWTADEGEVWHAIGLTPRFGPVGVTVGFELCKDSDGVNTGVCYKSILVGGVDFDATVRTQRLGGESSSPTLALGIRPSVGAGFGVAGGDSRFKAYAANVDAPISVSFSTGATARLVPFVAPGFGFGRLSLRGDRESGTHAALAAGVGFTRSVQGRWNTAPERRTQVGVHLSWRMLFVDDATSILGLGLSVGS